MCARSSGDSRFAADIGILHRQVVPEESEKSNSPESPKVVFYRVRQQGLARDCRNLTGFFPLRDLLFVLPCRVSSKLVLFYTGKVLLAFQPASAVTRDIIFGCGWCSDRWCKHFPVCEVIFTVAAVEWTKDIFSEGFSIATQCSAERPFACCARKGDSEARRPRKAEEYLQSLAVNKIHKRCWWSIPSPQLGGRAAAKAPWKKSRKIESKGGREIPIDTVIHGVHRRICGAHMGPMI